VEQRTRKVDDGAGGLVDQTVRFPVWFEPAANGTTPMCGAFDLAWEVLSEFLTGFPDCYPPLVINITDGRATDGHPESHAQCCPALPARDGTVPLFNAHVSAKVVQPVEFPDGEATLPDDFARLLFRMSSPLPPRMQDTARREGFAVNDATRGFVFNADLVSV